MKAFAIFALLAALSPAGLAQSAPTGVAGQAEADSDFARYLAAEKFPPPAGYVAKADLQAMHREIPPGYRELSAAEKIRWRDEKDLRLIAAGTAFYEKHPADPRRWTIVLALSRLNPKFLKAADPVDETATAATPPVDERARAAWAARIEEWRQAMALAQDVPESTREESDWTEFGKEYVLATQASKAGQPANWAGVTARLYAHLEKYPTLDAKLVMRSDQYFGAREAAVAGSTVADWAHLEATATNEALRLHAGDRRRLLEMMGKPLQLAFTAVDGRAVDLSRLRGKVVLIDFWATWCGPCVAEIPNIKNVYAAYHDKGFEVLGIALEDARLLPKDSPPQRAAKMENSNQVLNAFTASNAIPWPQYSDGKGWKNDIAVRFRIGGVPAMFLVGPDGQVVSTNARGPALEREVKSLLKLSPSRSGPRAPATNP